MTIEASPKRDDLLTDFGKTTLEDRYLQPNETYQDLFKRVATTYQEDDAHGQRLYEYMSKTWFMPSTPILSNAGTDRGLPISCFLNEVEDTLESIDAIQSENFWLAAKGGGIGTYWGNLRSIGEKVGNVGETSGVIPFLKIQDSQTLGISQGSLRRGSAATYLDINHPEIEEFLGMRKPTGGDVNRKCLNIHHGVVIDDKFMDCVDAGKPYDLVSPHSGEVIKVVDARQLWQKIMTLRMETGEPYMLFIDTVNDSIPTHHKEQDLFVTMSNLCAEIVQPTNAERTAVCCLASLNAETYDEWFDQAEQMVYDILLMLDNVLQSFIDTAPPTHAKAVYAAKMERSVGLGTMGFHGYLMANGIAWGSRECYNFNEQFYSSFDEYVYRANLKIGKEKGACPDFLNGGGDKKKPQRFSNASAIAPTASISIICGGSTPGTDPIPANIFNHKTLSGSFTVKNKHLEKVLRQHGKDTDKVWGEILANHGSVRGLSFLALDEKDVFKTAYEIDQMHSIRLTADRQNYINQSQSLNLYISPTASKLYVARLHRYGHSLGCKSFYYCRSKSLNRAEAIGTSVERVIIEECESCQ